MKSSSPREGGMARIYNPAYQPKRRDELHLQYKYCSKKRKAKIKKRHDCKTSHCHHSYLCILILKRNSLRNLKSLKVPRSNLPGDVIIPDLRRSLDTSIIAQTQSNGANQVGTNNLSSSTSLAWIIFFNVFFFL